MDDELIEKIKNKLGLFEDISDVELLKRLSEARSQSHPDLFSDPVIKVEKEEEFKKYNNFYSSLEKYLEEKRATMLPSKMDQSKKESFELMQKIVEVDKLKDEIKELSRKNLDINEKNEINEKEIENLKKENYSQKEKENNNSIKDIYKIKKVTPITSILSLLFLFLTQIGYIKDKLNLVFGIEHHLIITVICIILLVGTTLNILFKLLVRDRMKCNMHKLTNANMLEKNLKFRSSNTERRYLNYYYFDEVSLHEYIRTCVSKADSYIFYFQKDAIYEEFMNYVILYLDRKNIIKSQCPIGLIIQFKISVPC